MKRQIITLILFIATIPAGAQTLFSYGTHKVSREEFLALTTQVRVLDEGKVAAAVRRELRLDRLGLRAVQGSTGTHRERTPGRR